ncbi:MAG: ATP-dependent Clp protease adaptor ClpS [Phycisphaerales bacterium]
MSAADTPTSPQAEPAEQAHPRAPAPAAANRPAPSPQPPATDRLPPFRVLLHNDDVHDTVYVVETLVRVTPLEARSAYKVMMEAHIRGVSLVMTTHRERAELYAERLVSRGLTATVEPDR